jgi:hypothetical protein
MFAKVGWQPTDRFKKNFKDGLLDKIKIAFPLVCYNITPTIFKIRNLYWHPDIFFFLDRLRKACFVFSVTALRTIVA